MSHSVFALEDVIPSIDARFTFQDLDGPPFQLVVEMSPSSLDRIYEKTQVLWTRADGRDNSTLLSVFNIQLDECVLVSTTIGVANVVQRLVLGATRVYREYYRHVPRDS